MGEDNHGLHNQSAVGCLSAFPPMSAKFDITERPRRQVIPRCWLE
jgi:hypothetical protein